MEAMSKGRIITITVTIINFRYLCFSSLYNLHVKIIDKVRTESEYAGYMMFASMSESPSPSGLPSI